jgi:hypothetical protein
MKQEDKDLLLKDLCARLPYGVKSIRESWNYKLDSVIEVLEDIDKDGYINNTKVYNVEDIKPCLFPLSSMTEEQKEEYESLCIKNTSECTDLYGITFPKDYYDTIESFDYLYKNHIDIRGLIEKGLAIDCTNLNIY